MQYLMPQEVLPSRIHRGEDKEGVQPRLTSGTQRQTPSTLCFIPLRLPVGQEHHVLD